MKTPSGLERQDWRKRRDFKKALSSLERNWWAVCPVCNGRAAQEPGTGKPLCVANSEHAVNPE